MADYVQVYKYKISEHIIFLRTSALYMYVRHVRYVNFSLFERGSNGDSRFVTIYVYDSTNINDRCVRQKMLKSFICVSYLENVVSLIYFVLNMRKLY